MPNHHASRPAKSEREPVFPARGSGFLIPCPDCQEEGNLESIPDVGTVHHEFPVGHSKRETGGRPLKIAGTRRAAVRGCPTCKGRGAIPRPSLLDPYEIAVKG